MRLHGFLQSKKCLVVIDDIWAAVDWDRLKPAFPIGRDMGRSKILLTTRDKGLASHVDPHAYSHHPRLLNDDEAWELVQKKAFHGQGLRFLTLYDSKLEEDPMPALEKLPNLGSLKLESGSFVGLKMVCSGMGFPKLKHLSLWGLPNLEEWRVDEGAMPNLSSLEIVDCEKLIGVPDGLRFVTALQELIIKGMPEAFARRLKVVDGEEGADLYKVQHVPSIHIGW